jgi:hypothetical protein
MERSLKELINIHIDIYIYIQQDAKHANYTIKIFLYGAQVVLREYTVFSAVISTLFNKGFKDIKY